MPIIVGDKPIFRVKLADSNIREIEKGDTLKGGLYEITYVNSGPNTVPIGFNDYENIPDYVGGYPDYSEEDFYLYKPDDASATETAYILGLSNAFNSHCDGWYSNRSCTTLNYIPAITRDFHRDLTLYCKGRQRRYSGNGVYGYDKDTVETVQEGVGVED